MTPAFEQGRCSSAICANCYRDRSPSFGERNLVFGRGPHDGPRTDKHDVPSGSQHLTGLAQNLPPDSILGTACALFVCIYACLLVPSSIRDGVLIAGAFVIMSPGIDDLLVSLLIQQGANHLFWGFRLPTTAPVLWPSHSLSCTLTSQISTAESHPQP